MLASTKYCFEPHFCARSIKALDIITFVHRCAFSEQPSVNMNRNLQSYMISSSLMGKNLTPSLYFMQSFNTRLLGKAYKFCSNLDFCIFFYIIYWLFSFSTVFKIWSLRTQHWLHQLNCLYSFFSVTYNPFLYWSCECPLATCMSGASEKLLLGVIGDIVIRLKAIKFVNVRLGLHFFLTN